MVPQSNSLDVFPKKPLQGNGSLCQESLGVNLYDMTLKVLVAVRTLIVLEGAQYNRTFLDDLTRTGKMSFNFIIVFTDAQ